MAKSIADTIGDIAREVQHWQVICQNLNLRADIEWGTRSQIRTVQGHLRKSEDACAETLWSLGTDEAVELADRLWPPTDDDF